MSAANSPDDHVAGILVQAWPEHLARICDAIAAIPHAEVTHRAPEGRLVAVLEAPTGRDIVEQLDRIRALPGVLNVALVYQHAEPAQDMDKEVQG
jgi:nitrate reductase NapD